MNLHERAVAIRERLRNPPNAVVDIGIDLQRGRAKIDDHQIARISSPSIRARRFGIERARTQRLANAGHSVARITALVATRYGLTFDQLMSKERLARFVMPRHIAIFLARHITRRGTPDLGGRFNRDHSTVINTLDKVERLSISDFQFGAEIAAVECHVRRKLAGCQ